MIILLTYYNYNLNITYIMLIKFDQRNNKLKNCKL